MAGVIVVMGILANFLYHFCPDFDDKGELFIRSCTPQEISNF